MNEVSNARLVDVLRRMTDALDAIDDDTPEAQALIAEARALLGDDGGDRG